jgi:wobble nucleotide-excising tRNase
MATLFWTKNMITKIKTIKNIGSFFYFDWDSVNPSVQIDAEYKPINDKSGKQKLIYNKFKKFNVLFGENGTGKSTLVRLLKCLNSNSDDLISKNWDHEDNPCSFDIDTDSGSVTFDDVNKIRNNSFKDKILIFDREYIDKFVHSFPTGRASSHNKNTGNLILYLGNFFQYRTQLNSLSQLKSNLQDKNQNIKQTKDNAFIALKPEKDYSEIKVCFCSLSTNEISSLPLIVLKKQTSIIKIDKDIEIIKQKITLSADILTATVPVNCVKNITPIQSNVEEAFSFSISSNVAKTLTKIAGKENFIKEGMKITHEHALKECPFCQQSIKSSGTYIDSITQYDAVFDAAFTSGQAKASSGLQEYKDIILGILGFQLPVGNNAIVTKINKLIGTSDDLPEVTLTEGELKILKKELANIEEKEKNITFVIPSNVLSIISIFVNLNLKIDIYNAKINSIVKNIEQAKKEISAGNLPTEKNTLEVLLGNEKLKLFVCENHRALSIIIEKEQTIVKNENTIAKISILFDALRKKVEELFTNFVSIYFSQIQKNLSIFCPDLQLEMIGTHPKYDLRVGDVTCGLEVHYKNKDRLKDLSEGERQSIALSYFLAYLNREQLKNDMIVVFDDPINSFDTGRRKQASELIYKEAINFMQLFIFTCDPLFKSYCLKVSNKRLGENRNFYYILKSASSSIHYRPREYCTIYSSFKHDFLNINHVIGTDDMIVVFGQKLRYCLEEIKDRHLGYSEDKFESILDAVESGKITKLIEKIDDIRELYSYCNTGGLAHFPKDGQTSWIEIKSQIDKYMKLGL